MYNSDLISNVCSQLCTNLATDATGAIITVISRKIGQCYVHNNEQVPRVIPTVYRFCFMWVITAHYCVN